MLQVWVEIVHSGPWILQLVNPWIEEHSRKIMAKAWYGNDIFIDRSDDEVLSFYCTQLVCFQLGKRVRNHIGRFGLLNLISPSIVCSLLPASNSKPRLFKGYSFLLSLHCSHPKGLLSLASACRNRETRIGFSTSNFAPALYLGRLGRQTPLKVTFALASDDPYVALPAHRHFFLAHRAQMLVLE